MGGFLRGLADAGALPLCCCFDLSQRCPLTSIWSCLPGQAATCDLREPAVAQGWETEGCLTLLRRYFKWGRNVVRV